MTTGEQVGPYLVEAAIGEGGMGAVYRARDTRLDRTVALKVSKSDFSDRFEREAKAVAALNHPNICTLFDVGPNYLVMEYIEGTPLKGPLPVEKVIEYGGQILDALDAAHRKGFTHRDLKPANILVTKQGVKLLDFGLAKQAAPLQPTDATLTKALTGEGQIVGTLQYMSPEQLQGRPADARSDLFAFGCLLYEMLSGKRAFTGESAASIIAAILDRQPTALELPPPLDRVLSTCLAKDPDQRFQSAIDLKRALLWANTGTTAAVERLRLPVWTLALPLLLAAGLGLMWWRTRPEPVVPSAITRLTRDGRSSNPSLSPDGKLIAFQSSRADNNLDIYVQQSNGTAPVRLTNDPAQDSDPVFSADGSRLYFSSSRNPKGIYEVPALGGDARLVIADATEPRPSPDGRRMAYALADAWYVDTIPGSKPIPIGPPGANFHHPVWSPDGARLLILEQDRKGAASWDFVILSVAGQQRQPIGLRNNLLKRRMAQSVRLEIMRWLPNDDLLFTTSHGDADNLWRIPLRDAATGVPSPVTVGTSGELMADAIGNRVVYASSNATPTLWSLPCDLNTAKIQGPAMKLLPGQTDASHPDVTPDGAQLVYCSRRNGPRGVWVRDLRTGKDRLLAQMNLYGDDYSHTVIRPDGKQVAALAQSPDSPMQVVLLDGATGAAKHLSPKGARLRGWTPDGRLLLLRSYGRGGGVDVLEVATGAASRILARGNEIFEEPRLSADGRWLAFVGADQKLYLAPFHGSQPIPESEWILVAGAGVQPAWAPDGKSLYYVTREAGATLLRQPLDPVTKRPIGGASFFYGFEGMVFGHGVANPIAVARDQIILCMAEPNSDLWAIDLPPTAGMGR